MQKLRLQIIYKGTLEKSHLKKKTFQEIFSPQLQHLLCAIYTMNLVKYHGALSPSSESSFYSLLPYYISETLRWGCAYLRVLAPHEPPPLYIATPRPDGFPGTSDRHYHRQARPTGSASPLSRARSAVREDSAVSLSDRSCSNPLS